MSFVTSRRGLGAVIGLGLLWGSTAASGALVTFDSSDDMDLFFERGSGSAVFSWTDSVGVGTPLGSVTSTNGGNADTSHNLFYTAETFSIADGPLEVSVMFKAVAGTGGGSTGSYSRNFVGFASGTDVNLATQDGKLGVRVFKETNKSKWTFQVQSGTSTLNISTDITLTDGNWYRMTATITRTDASKFDVAGELLDFGADGQTLNGAFAYSGHQEFTNSTMGGAEAWYAGLLNQINDGGASHFDNLSIVPEPGAALGLAMAGMMLVRRRGRSA